MRDTIGFCVVTTLVSAAGIRSKIYVMTRRPAVRDRDARGLYLQPGFQTAPYDLGSSSAIAVYLFCMSCDYNRRCQKICFPPEVTRHEKNKFLAGDPEHWYFCCLQRWCCFHCYWLGVSAFKSDTDVIRSGRQSFPDRWVTTCSLPMCGKCSRLPECCLTRLCVCRGCHHHQSVFDSMAAYAFARMKFTGRNCSLESSCSR